MVADTNIVVSGLLWTGGPRLLLDAARAGVIELVTSPVLLEELAEVLQRPKFDDRLRQAQVSALEVSEDYAALATIVNPETIEPVISADPDDDHVLACAIAAIAELIVSGDNHLLQLKEYRGVRIVPVSQALIDLPRDG